jgi:hypothetical protein
LSGLILSLLLGILVLGGALVDVLLGSLGSLAFLDFSDSLLSKGLLVLGTGSLDLFNIFQGDSLNGAFLSEDFLLLVLAEISLLEFLVESAPGSGPSEALGLQLPILDREYLKLKSRVRLLRKRKGRPSLAT